MIRKFNSAWIIPLAIVGMLVVAALLYPSLPDELPIQWGFDGQVNRTAPKAIAVLLLPALATLIWVGMAILPRIDPRREQYKKFSKTYLRLRIAVVVFMFGMQVITLTQYDKPFVIVKLVLFAASVMLAVLGNEMGRIRQTWFVGIRTPWTLADERVWRRTHRVGARYFFGMAVLNMILVVLLPPQTAGLFFAVSILVVSLGITAYSYVVYKRLND